MKSKFSFTHLFLVGLLSFGMSGCGLNWGIKGQGSLQDEERTLPAFDAIQNQVNADIFIKQGPQEAIVIEGQENILAVLETKVRQERLEISFTEQVSYHDGLKVYITIPEVRELGLSGSGSFSSENLLAGENLAIHISGSGEIDLAAEYEELNASVSGSGDMELEGSARLLDIQVSGSGDVHALDFEVEEAEVQVSGSGNCEVNVKEKLNVSISGSGDVRYKGRPVISSSISGSGDLNPVE